MERQQFKNVEEYDKARRESMNGRVNPCFILRNYLLENALFHVSIRNDYTEFNKLLEQVRNPFDTS